MIDIQFDRYYRYAPLTALLNAFVAAYPQLCRIESLGRSYEGRDIWVAVVTNMATGSDSEKPAFWVDGNIHATELSASTAALYLLNKVLTGYGSDARITHLLDTRALYIVPRVNPDGAEWALADSPRYIRSSTRPWPRTDQRDGLVQQDVDGNGRLLQMRLRDPLGNWKPHPEEPRLLVRREPDDLPGGAYYRLLPEGIVHNYDGVLIEGAPSLQGLDLNRQFPVNWTVGERGAGDYPGREPETRALIDFVVAHPNITGSISLHTFSGVHLRPLTKGPDSDMPTQDLRIYKQIGAKAEALTGYPAISVHHEFKYDPKEWIKGTFDDWMYEERGVYAWTTEIWSPQRRAGLTDYKYIEWFDDHSPADDLKIYRWLADNGTDDFFFDWTPFDHPQLGPVEIGGWNTLASWTNPPLNLLEAEVAPLADFAIYQAGLSPQLVLHQLDVESSGDAHRVRLVLANTGFLPTNITQQALSTKVAKPLEIDLMLPDGARLLTGQAKTMADQLPGRAHKGAAPMWSADFTDNLKKIEWVVQAPAGSEIAIVAHHERAGVVRATATLGK